MKCITFLRFIAVTFLAVLSLTAAVHAQTSEDKSAVIVEGSKVAIQFTIYLADGSVFGGNQGGDPLVYEQGKGNIPPGLEAALIGLRADDRKKVTLAPEDAYGPENPEAFVDVQIDRLPEGARTVGAGLIVNDPSGNRRYVTVHQIKDDTAVINLNHPLAGKEITFDVLVLTVD